MKLERLQRLLEQRGRLKVYLLNRDMALCGHASKPHMSALGLRVVVDASVRVVFGSTAIVHEPLRTGTLFLTGADKVTRRVQTHRRHLSGLDVPADYFAQAETL